MQMKWYENKRVVLTGATSGIGKELLNRLVLEGATVVAVGRNVEGLPQHERIIPFRCDISRQENIDPLFDFALEQLGRIDLFFANAGFGYCEELNEPDWDHIDSIFRTNVYSPIYSLEKMLSLYKEEEFSFVITASEVARTPMAGFSLYTSTKFAVDGFAQTIQLELPVNAHLSVVYPVAMKTSFFSRSGENAPLPIFRQRVEKTVHVLLKCVARKKKYIHPMPVYNLSVWFIRVFPPIGRLALKLSSKPFKKWIKSKQ